jgi:hypothetical protein
MRRGEVSPAEGLRGAPEPLARVVSRLLAADPEGRYESMGEALDQLERTSSDPLSGLRPLSALVQRLMEDAAFDPFDVVRDPDPALEQPGDIPLGEAGAASGELAYEEIRIEVDQGEGTPGSLIRAAVPAADGGRAPRDPAQPASPFLETIPEVQATATTAAPQLRR